MVYLTVVSCSHADGAVAEDDTPQQGKVVHKEGDVGDVALGGNQHGQKDAQKGAPVGGGALALLAKADQKTVQSEVLTPDAQVFNFHPN